jgi:hypothetical protein
MTLFRILLGLMFAALVAYTLVVGLNHGWNLLPIFFGDMANMTWPGQFNLDFMGFLILSGLWLAWRHHFTPAGIALGVLGVFGGMGVLLPYLLVVHVRNKGDMRAVMMGPARATT